MNLTNDIDGFDLLLCVAMFGGFWKGEWLPFALLVIFAIVAGERK